MNDALQQPMKRKLLALLCSLPWLGACRAGSDPFQTDDPTEDALRQRFRGLSIVLVVGVARGAKMDGIEIHSDQGWEIFSGSSMGGGGQAILAVGSARVPRWVRVTWRKDDANFKVISSGAGIEYKGTIIGDYTLPVADRIPDAVLESLRKNPRGDLRIKFRLHPKGVYFGWDIDRGGGKVRAATDHPPYELTGGDFKETRPADYVLTNKGLVDVPYMLPPLSEADEAFLKKHQLYTYASGQVWEKGWYIDKNGQRKTEPIDCGVIGGLRNGDSTVTCAMD